MVIGGKMYVQAAILHLTVRLAIDFSDTKSKLIYFHLNLTLVRRALKASVKSVKLILITN